MPADGLTKALSRQQHEKFIRQLNLIDIGQHLIRQQPASSVPQEAEGVCQPPDVMAP